MATGNHVGNEAEVHKLQTLDLSNFRITPADKENMREVSSHSSEIKTTQKAAFTRTFLYLPKNAPLV